MDSFVADSQVLDFLLIAFDCFVYTGASPIDKSIKSFLGTIDLIGQHACMTEYLKHEQSLKGTSEAYYTRILT